MIIQLQHFDIIYLPVIMMPFKILSKVIHTIPKYFTCMSASFLNHPLLSAMIAKPMINNPKDIYFALPVNMEGTSMWIIRME